MARRQRRDSFAPFRQRAASFVWPTSRAVEQHAADTLAPDIFARQNENVFALDFVPAGAMHHRNAARYSAPER